VRFGHCLALFRNNVTRRIGNFTETSEKREVDGFLNSILKGKKSMLISWAIRRVNFKCQKRARRGDPPKCNGKRGKSGELEMVKAQK
jgi:hypothetical protein